ncbi:MAG: hypothetical protein Q9181_001056 [Wetmoreana brouardii]
MSIPQRRAARSSQSGKSAKSEVHFEIDQKSLNSFFSKLHNIKGNDDLPQTGGDQGNCSPSRQPSISSASTTRHESNRKSTAEFSEGKAVYCDTEYGQIMNERKRVRYICGCTKKIDGKLRYRLKDRPPSDPSNQTVLINGEEWILEKDITRVPADVEIMPDGTVIIEKRCQTPVIQWAGWASTEVAQASDIELLTFSLELAWPASSTKLV